MGGEREKATFFQYTVRHLKGHFKSNTISEYFIAALDRRHV